MKVFTTVVKFWDGNMSRAKTDTIPQIEWHNIAGFLDQVNWESRYLGRKDCCYDMREIC